MTKKAQLIRLMERSEGVSLDAAVKSLKWQPHTVRAAISKLKKQGYAIKRIETTKGYRYVIKADEVAA